MCLGRCKAAPPQVLQPFQGYFPSRRPVLKLRLGSTVRDQISGVEVHPREQWEQCLVPHPSRPTFCSQECPALAKVHPMSEVSILYQPLCFSTQVGITILFSPLALASSILAPLYLRFAASRPPYTGSPSAEQKSCCSPQKAHPKCQRAHHNSLCFYP